MNWRGSWSKKWRTVEVMAADQTELLKDALIHIRSLRARLQAAEGAAREPIAILDRLPMLAEAGMSYYEAHDVEIADEVPASGA